MPRAAWHGRVTNTQQTYPPLTHIETSVTRPGWTVGGGVEWAFWNNWSAKVEYDFYNFNMRNLAFPGTIADVPEVVPGIDIKESISTVKFGVNYRF
jgi:outer membrane immunogenic protein